MHGLGHIFNFLPTSILSANDHDDDDHYDDDDDGDENSEPGQDPVPVDVVEPEDPHQLLLLGALQQQREVHHKVLMRMRMRMVLVTMTMKMMIAMSMVTMMMTMKMMIAMTMMTMIKTIMMVMITTTMMMMAERPTPKVRPPEPDSSRREKM